MQKYGKVFGIFELTRPKLIVADADLIKTFMVKDFNSLMDSRTDDFTHPIELKMTFVKRGEDWRAGRSVLTPAFSSRFKEIYEQFEHCADNLLDFFDHIVSTGKGNDIDARDLFKNYFSDVISRSIFSMSFFESYSSSDKLTESIIQYFYTDKIKMMFAFLLPRWLRIMIKFSTFQIRQLDYPVALFRKILQERKKMQMGKGDGNNKNNQPRADALKLMMDVGHKCNWSDDDIISNLILSYAAGFHSSTLLLANVTYVLAKYPHVRGNIIREINDLRARGEKMTLETVTSEFKYLDAVISETQRMYPTSTFAHRMVSAEEYTFEYEGQRFTLPKDTLVQFPIFLIHHDPDYYWEPEKFDETRFLPENKGSLHPYAFLPFGHGPRNCIGIRFALTSVKLAIIRTIETFTFKLVDGIPDPMNDLSATIDELIVTQPIRVKVEKCPRSPTWL